MDAYSVVERYYSKLISLPSSGVIALGMVLVAATLSSLWLILTSYAVLLPLLLLAYLSSEAVYISVLRIAVRKRHITLRRLGGLVLAAVLLYSLAEALGILRRVAGMGLAASAGFTFLVLSGFESIPHAALTSLAASILSLLPLHVALRILGLETVDALPLQVATSLISVSLFAALLAYVRSLGRDHGLNPLSFARGFVNVWMGGEEAYLEEEFARVAEVRELYIDLLRVCRDGRRDVVLAIPGIHFGPFRTIGSSALPYHIDEELGKVGMYSLVLHSAGSHEHNAVYSRDSRDIARFIARISASIRCSESLAQPFRVHENGFESFTFATHNRVVLFISNPQYGADDLPYELLDAARELEGRAPYETISIVDSHNVRGESPRDIRHLAKLLTKASHMITPMCEDGLVGFAEVHVDGYVKGVCSNRVKVLLLRCNGKDYALVYVYGNNAEPSVRASIMKLLKSLGVTDGEFVTPDDHTCAATAMDSPYHVVHVSPTLLEAVKRGVEAARRDLAPAKVGFARIRRRMLIVGDSVWRLIEILDRAGSKMVKLLPVAVALSVALPCVLLLA